MSLKPHLKSADGAKSWTKFCFVLKKKPSYYTLQKRNHGLSWISHIHKSKITAFLWKKKKVVWQDAEQELSKGDKDVNGRIKSKHEILVLEWRLTETNRYQEGSSVRLIWSSEKSVSYSVFKNIFITFKLNTVICQYNCLDFLQWIDM